MDLWKSLTSFCIEQSFAGPLRSSRLQGCFGCLAKDGLIMFREWPLVSDMLGSNRFDTLILLCDWDLDFLSKYLISLRQQRSKNGELLCELATVIDWNIKTGNS
ncbi:hypothetical protein C3L33_03489, partial [Rhododendron williamsianum]